MTLEPIEAYVPNAGGTVANPTHVALPAGTAVTARANSRQPYVALGLRQVHKQIFGSTQCELVHTAERRQLHESRCPCMVIVRPPHRGSRHAIPLKQRRASGEEATFSRRALSDAFRNTGEHFWAPGERGRIPSGLVVGTARPNNAQEHKVATGATWVAWVRIGVTAGCVVIVPTLRQHALLVVLGRVRPDPYNAELCVANLRRGLEISIVSRATD